MRRLIPLVALLGALLFWGPGGTHASLFPAIPVRVTGQPGVGQMSLDAYRQTIARAQVLVEGGDPHQAADLLAGITLVALPSGETMPVDHSWFVAILRSDEPDLTTMSVRLAALSHELDVWPTHPPTPDAFEKLADVLARPEFQPKPQVDLSPLLEWLSQLFDFLPPLSGMPWLGNLLLIGAVVVLAGIVAYFASGLWGSFAAQAEIDEEGAEAGLLTAGQALNRSREMAQAGDYRTAVRLLYLSTLLMLEERNLLRYDRTLTNREYLRQVADNSPLEGALRPVVDTFDEVWYGEVEPDAERYEAYAHQVDRVREVKE